LKQELLGNPFLELVEPEEETEVPLEEPKEEEKEKEGDDEPNWEDILLDDGADSGVPPRDMSEAREYVEPVPVEAKDLSVYLREQVQLLDLTPRQQLLAQEFIGNIAEDGYLGATLEEIVRGANQLLEEHAVESEAEVQPQLFTPAEAEEMLRIIQKLDPPGVGARDLRECLMLQLEARGQTDTLVHRLVRDAFDDLKAHRWSDLGKRFGLDAAEVQKVADDLAKLDPKPGLQHSAANDAYIIPDLVVEKIDGEYKVFLNDSGLPRLRISKTYQEIARDKKKFQGENKDFINQRMNSAHWMIQAIEQRRQTMLKVMNFIVDRQREFFEKGVEFLKPLTLREVADVINMHESTVSRVTNEKYVQTPRGLLPLKFFFSSGLSTTTGEDASARAIRAQIQKMVADEDLKNPLTDQQIVEMFAQKGVKIARRTVAKYREALKIAPANLRRTLGA
jgi:RNA polymerase sigma-54 factor